ncbi:MAG: outer membrane beta-barrel protein [Bacteroidales bacterium]|nr:outer membrane beta-barrel protein [Bacteroidales bacterium]
MRGRVQNDEFPYHPLYPVKVEIEMEQGEVLGTNTNMRGEFSFSDIKPGRIGVFLSHPGFIPRYDSLTVSPGINVLLFRMEQVQDTIVAAVVTTSRQIIREIGDTTVVAAKHIETMDGESAMEMIRQVPGVTVTPKGISYNGKKVRRTYVNGILLFGDDTRAALNSLYAKDVTEVKIYDEQSPEDKHRGNTGGIKETVMNLITSGEILKVTDVSLALGGGSQKRFSALQKAEFFSEKLILKERLIADNINPDLIEISSLDPTVRGAIVDDTRRLAGEVSAERHWKDRLFGNSLTVSARYVNDRARHRNVTDRFYLDDPAWNHLHLSDTSFASDQSGSFVADLILDMKDTRIKSWALTNRFSLTSADIGSERITHSFDGATLLNKGVSSSSNHSRNWDYSGVFSWVDNDHANFRPSFHADVKTGRLNGTGSLVDTLPTSILQRLLHLTESQRFLTLGGGASLSNVLMNRDEKSLSMATEYNISFANKIFTKNALDFLGNPTNPTVDVLNTRDYSERQLSNRLTVSFTYLSGKWLFNAGVAGQLDQKYDEDRYPGPAASMNKTFPSICPHFTIGYGRNIKLEIKTEAVAPSLDMLRDKTDNSNPYFIIKGNPELQQEYVLNASAGYNKTYPKKNSSIALLLTGSISDRSLTSHSFMDGNSIVATYENAPGKKSVNTSFTYHKIIPRKGLTLDSRLLFAAVGAPEYNFNDLVTHKSFRSSWSTSARWRFKRRLSVSGSFSLNGVTGSSGDFKSASIGENLELSVGYTFGEKRFNLVGRYNLNNSNRISGHGIDHLSQDLSMKFGWWILPQKLEISVSGHDLIQKAEPYSQIMTAAYEQISTSSVLGRYLMLNLRYIFKRK